MKQLALFLIVAALATPAFAADLKVTTSKHTDASKVMGQDTPAKDSVSTTWIGKDRMRTEEGDSVTIVRTDLKKMFVLHTKDKTYSSIDLPFDMKKYLPPQAAPMIEAQLAQMKVTLTPTTETKKVKDWNATKYTLTMNMQMMTMTSDVWVTKDIAVDHASYGELQSAMFSMMPGGSTVAAEFKKIEGYPVLTEKTRTVMGAEMKGRDEVTAVETKDAPEGAYEIPKDFTEKPFDMMSDNPEGGMGGGNRGGRGMGGPGRPGGGHPPGDKPVDPPKVPPTPEPK